MIVYDRLWQTLKKRGISKYALREKYLVDTRLIRRLAANMNTTTGTLSQLCETLDCRLEDIAEYVPDPKR